ncbi:MAG: hypothetical protein H7333_09810 [Bdellovibrionales bacterium]|nr:hypothetical protein [Oligoflexia bacterium]
MKNIELYSDSRAAIRTTPGFYSGANELRTHFENKFKNPYQANHDRFCWDYWSIKNQYRLLRSPAEQFFPKTLFAPFLSRLLSYGRETLGCQMISHPWLSAYIDGSFQNLHSDVPHGPFSFVYSLTPWNRRKFTGGETLVANPKLLRYFSELKAGESHEEKNLLIRVPPVFNQLTLFDPRYPHGVARVDGVEDILQSRLVIHGWFTEPRPMLEGALSFKKIAKPLDQLAHSLMNALAPLPYSGLLSLKYEILPTGKISSITVLSAHLVDGLGQVIPSPLLKSVLKQEPPRFPLARQKTWITLPLEINA